MFSVLNAKQIINNQPNNPLYRAQSIIGHSDDVHENESEHMTCEQWFLENIPFIHTPDSKLDEVYYFRWSNLLAALGKRRQDGKYMFCESAVGSFYHRYIDCAQGAHIRDARWIRDKRYLQDYLDVTPDTASYREYITDSVWQKYLLDADTECLRRNYPKLKARLRSLDREYDKESGLYHCFSDAEGQECAVNAFELVDSYIHIQALPEGFRISSDLSQMQFTGMRLIFASTGTQNPDFYADGKALKYTAAPLAYPKNAWEYFFDAPVKGAVTLGLGGNGTTVRIVPLYEIVPAWTEQWRLLIDGHRSFRVGNNACQIAANCALSKMARRLGLPEEAAAFEEAAAALRKALMDQLWSKDRHFFLERTLDGQQIQGKECSAYAPWAFSLVPDEPEYAEAFRYMFREDCFLSRYGLTSLEKADPHYMQPYNHTCLWNGPVWPYTFSLALTALAKHLQTSQHAQVTKQQYYELLSRYAACHRESRQSTVLGLRENHHPEENRWIATAGYYNHSTFIDNILSGLFGISPEESSLDILPLIPDSWKYFCVENLYIRGQSYTVMYDESGEVYHQGAGFQIRRNGQRVFHGNRVCNVRLALEPEA